MSTEQSKTKTINDIRIEDLKTYSEADIQALLSRSPFEKQKAGQWAIKAYEVYTNAKLKTKRVEAKFRMIAKTKKDLENLTSDADRKAWALNQKEYKKAQDEELGAEIKYKLADLTWQGWDDLFVAVRKLANMVEQDVKSQHQAQKYGQ